MKKNKLLIVAFVGICISILLYFSSTSYAIILDNDVRVKENSDLTYYLDISYDGKDKNVVMSSDTARAEIRSDYIYVEDKIPDGLVFKEFINSSDGSIGAVERGDSSKSCSGSVVGGYDGLKYDEATRMVSFSIKDLQAGCKLTVGIVTTTPSLGAEKRMDFSQEKVIFQPNLIPFTYLWEKRILLYTMLLINILERFLKMPQNCLLV